jgi:hypothetical protein
MQEGARRFIEVGCKTWLGGTLHFRRLTRPCGIDRADLDIEKAARREIITPLHRDMDAWLERRGLPLARTLGLERSGREGLHAHFAVAVHRDCARDLRAWMRDRIADLAGVESVTRDALRWNGRFHEMTAAAVVGWTLYGAKGMVPEGKTMAGVKGPKPEKRMLPTEGRTLLYSFRRLERAGERPLPVNQRAPRSLAWCLARAMAA